jgi:hypothetical protein
VGYNTFDDGSGYTYADMDGRTCVTTVAADLAVGRGVVVVNSAGNEASSGWRGVTAPGDGDSVLAIGAVSLGGRRADFSSCGPTPDGRIKPDAAALGVGVYCANPSRTGFSDYLFASGTSFSCPLVAGVCALVLDAHPDLRPMEVVKAVRRTASQADEPDTLLGWGIVNAYQAIFYHGMIVRNIRAIRYPFENQTFLQFDLFSDNGILEDSVMVRLTTDGSSFRVLQARRNGYSGNDRFEIQVPPETNPDQIQFYIETSDSVHRHTRSPFGAPQALYDFSVYIDSTVSNPSAEYPYFIVRTGYPNPFSEKMRIEMDIHHDGLFDFHFYDIRGREVRLFQSKELKKGTARIEWDGKSSDGNQLPSGLYLCRIRTEKQSESIKIIKVK